MTASSGTTGETAATEGALRRLVLALVLFGAAGLSAELVLLEHYESVRQWTPLALLALALGAGALLLTRPSARAVHLFRAAMALLLAAAAAGLYLHYRGNAEFEREMDDALRGPALLWRSLRGATPALAPGALAQLALLGLIGTHRHPALRRRAARPDPRPSTETP